MAHVAPWKKEEVAKLTSLLTENDIVGVAEIGGIPAPQMAEMRASLRDEVQLVGTKNRLLKLAIAEAAKSKPGLEQLEGKIDGQMAVIATSMNPFKLYKKLEAGATMAPVKGGQPAPNDITVEKGPTAFGPGPIVGEFQKVGIPAKIEGGKVVITKTVTPAKEGEVVGAELALMLAKLEIKPVQLKIALKAAFEQDTLFTPDVLDIDEDQILGEFMLAARTGHEVALEAAWATKQTIDALIGRAFRASKNLALDVSWVTKETAEELIGKGYKIAVAAALESGFDLGDAQDAAAAAYANVLASTGKTESDLSHELKERLSNHLGAFSGAAVAAAPAASDAAPAAEEEDEEEEVSEEEAAAGLGALFG
ncbi:MAG: 50S ribosomal protein L10 [Thermoplasmatota archaeon]